MSTRFFTGRAFKIGFWAFLLDLLAQAALAQSGLKDTQALQGLSAWVLQRQN